MKTNEPRREGAKFKKTGSGSKPTGSKPTGSKPTGSRPTGSKPAKLSPAGRPLKGKPKPKPYAPRTEFSADRPDRGPRNDGPREDRPYNKDARPFNREDRPREERAPRPYSNDRPREDRAPRPYSNDRPREDRPFNKDARPFNREDRPREDRAPRPYSNDRPREDRPFNKDARPFNREDRPREDRAPRPYSNDRPREDRPFNKDARPFNREDRPREDRAPRPYSNDRGPRNDDQSNDRPREDRPFNREDRPYNREERGNYDTERRNSAYTKPQSAYKGGRPVTGNPTKRWHAPTVKTAETHGLTDGAIRLNRFLARAGVCSRRDADKLIADGMVMVNGQVVLEMGHKVMPSDEVRYAGEVLKSEKKMYLVLNKPKGFITSMDDEKARKTVMELIRGACRERIYPVGRLDRATTGVLLFTNDGDMAKKLTHPSHGAKKIYSVSLDKPLSKAHFAELAQGIELEDGPIKADEISQVEAQDAREIGISLHSGRNRIVRRMFEHLGYEVVRLDRVQFGPITKKNLARGHYRLLNEKEIAFLKMLG
jgi:23S rRNA pseudouridine2605 synthase